MFAKPIALRLGVLIAVVFAIDAGYARLVQTEVKLSPGTDPAAPTEKSPGVDRQAELETEFRSALTGATLEGTWQMTGEGGLTSRAPLTDAKPDRYTIATVEKGLEDHWVVGARIEFADKDVTVPVPVRVVWAGDTAVITVDEIPIPLVGTYSARVMIHKGFYSGIWYSTGKNYGGVMSGRIVPKAENAPEEQGKRDAGGE